MKKLIFIVTSLITLLSTSSVFAASGHGDGHVATISDLQLFFINFAIYLALMVYMLRRVAPSLWAERRRRIQDTIFSSRAKMAAAEQNISAARGKLAGVDAEVKRIKNNIEQETKRELEEISESSKRAAARVVSQARDSIEAERKISETAIRRSYAELALKLAEERLRGDINADKDKSLRDKAQSGLKALLQ